jgi:hypothetical protein
MSCNLGGVSLSDKLQSFTFRSTKLVTLVYYTIMEMIINLVVAFFYMNYVAVKTPP